MYDNDTRFSTWLSEGGAMGIEPDFSGGLAGGLGRRKRRKRAASAVVRRGMTRAEKRRAAAAVRAALPSSVPARVRRAARVASIAPASVVAAAPVASAPAFDAAAADSFQQAFSAAASAVPASDAVAVLPGGGDGSFVVAAPADLPAEVEDVAIAAGEGGPDAPLDVETLEGLGKFKPGKFLKRAVKAVAPVASMVGAAALPGIGGALVGAAGSALSSRVGSSRVGSMASGVSSIGDALRNAFRDAVGRVGDALVDAAGNIVAQQSGGRWVRVVPTLTPDTPKPRTAGASSISPAVLIGGAALVFLLMSKRR